MIKNKRLSRDEFFGHEMVMKITTQINKRSKNGINTLQTKDKVLIDLLKCNIDWLDLIGISIKMNNSGTMLCIRWGEETSE